MKTPSSRRFPVTVSHLPVIRCQICLGAVPYRPGKVNAVRTEHYRRVHLDASASPPLARLRILGTGVGRLGTISAVRC
jgi:hypothetical protein